MRLQGFPRRVRLRRRREFLRVQGRGKKHQMRYFLVFVSATPRSADPGPRLGVTVTRKVGCAVVRNRIKRWVREAFRRQRPGFKTGLDMVWVAKHNASRATYRDVVQDFEALRGRRGMAEAAP